MNFLTKFSRWYNSILSPAFPEESVINRKVIAIQKPISVCFLLLNLLLQATICKPI